MNFKRKLKFNNRHKALSLVLFLAALVLFLPQAARADWVTTIVGGLASGIASVLGWILAKVMAVLVYIAQYNNFIHAGAVANGWVIARDISNMFFVVILLVIAFGTILRLENYSYKKWLPKLILMAILINFSKTICGLLIDIAQVVMLTFVNAFKDVMAGGLVDMLGITGWQKLDGFEDVSSWEVAGAFVLSVIYSAIALITVTAMLGMLVMRIIMIWVYVVLSPFAYLLAAFPGGANYSKMWWSDFTKNLVVGPVLAFFIWLSFTSLVSFNNQSLGIDGSPQDPNKITCQQDESGVCKKGTTDIMIKFVISIAMLLGGMKIAQEIGGAAAGVAGKISSAGNKLAIGGAALVGAKGLKWTGKQLGDLRDITSEKLGVDLNVAAGYKRYRAQVEGNRELRKTRIYDNSLKEAEEGKTWIGRKAALMSTGDVAWQNIVDGRFFRGDPNKSKKALAEIDTISGENGTKTKLDSEIEDLSNQSIITKNEKNGLRQNVNNIDASIATLTNDRDAITKSASFKDLEKKEKNYTITEAEEKDLAQKRDSISKIDANIAKKQGQKDEIENKIKNSVVVNNNQERDDLIVSNAETIAEKQEASIKLGSRLKELTEVLQKNKLSEVQTSRAGINAKIEGEASKKLSNINNSDQLVSIFHEAVDAKDKGLMMAAYKKLAKQGNYNDLHRDLGMGTGYEGMLAMSKYLETEGGMSQQDARGTIADVGEIAKSVKHYEAFGAMSMNKAGQWEETGADQQEAAIFSEKAKVQVQAYVRDGNRLANGSYRNGAPHTADNWDISKSTIKLFASKDSQYAEEMKKTGNVNSIMFIAANKQNLETLRKNGAVETAKVIEEIAAKAKNSDVSSPLKAIRSIVT